VTEHQELRFPEGFRWGAATASYQVEGNCSNCDWWHWEHEHDGFIIDGTKSGIAADHYNRFEEDFALAAELGHNTYRFSIEWSRIEPEEGRWDQAEVDHYRRVLESLHRHGMTPLVTLFHWTNPIWIARKGGWLNPDVVDYVARYSRFIAHELGDLVPVWLTVNEPMVLAVLFHGLGIIPPFESGKKNAGIVAQHVLKAHARMYEAVHEATGHNPLVGPVHNLEYVEPADPESEEDRELARTLDLTSNEFFLAGVSTGTIGLPWGNGEVVPGLKNSWDVIGVNYYTRSRVFADRRRSASATDTGGISGISQQPLRRIQSLRAAAAEINSPYFSPWTEVGTYPKGLYKQLMRVAKYGRPIYITENGLATIDEDARNRYLVRHLREAHRAIEDGVDLRGYCYWSLLETWEWTLGHMIQMGMFALEPETLKRLPRPIAYLFRDISESNTINAAQLKEYGD
jgi:beta-glucosidase